MNDLEKRLRKSKLNSWLTIKANRFEEIKVINYKDYETLKNDLQRLPIFNVNSIDFHPLSFAYVSSLFNRSKLSYTIFIIYLYDIDEYIYVDTQGYDYCRCCVVLKEFKKIIDPKSIITVCKNCGEESIKIKKQQFKSGHVFQCSTCSAFFEIEPIRCFNADGESTEMLGFTEIEDPNL